MLPTEDQEERPTFQPQAAPSKLEDTHFAVGMDRPTASALKPAPTMIHVTFVPQQLTAIEQPHVLAPQAAMPLTKRPLIMAAVLGLLTALTAACVGWLLCWLLGQRLPAGKSARQRAGDLVRPLEEYELEEANFEEELGVEHTSKDRGQHRARRSSKAVSSGRVVQSAKSALLDALSRATRPAYTAIRHADGDHVDDESDVASFVAESPSISSNPFFSSARASVSAKPFPTAAQRMQSVASSRPRRDAGGANTHDNRALSPDVATLAATLPPSLRERLACGASLSDTAPSALDAAHAVESQVERLDKVAESTEEVALTAMGCSQHAAPPQEARRGPAVASRTGFHWDDTHSTRSRRPPNPSLGALD